MVQSKVGRSNGFDEEIAVVVNAHVETRKQTRSRVVLRDDRGTGKAMPGEQGRAPVERHAQPLPV
jgi:hypothetical protein